MTTAEFTLDTSGFVKNAARSAPHSYQWSDLSPFAQGYVEALLSDEALRKAWWLRNSGPFDIPAAVPFRFLHPEAIAMILRDCERALTWNVLYGQIDNAGRVFWGDRQAGRIKRFPPLRVCLDDAGKVRLEVVE